MTDQRASTTAFSVMAGFLRKLRMYPEDKDFFEHDTFGLGTHIIETAYEAEPFEFSLKALVKAIVHSLPIEFQSKFFGWVVPGYDTLITARKAMIKTKVDTGIKDGVQQIVILVGGYCPQGYLTAVKNSDVQVFEVDRGQTREQKLSALNKIPTWIKLPALDAVRNFHPVECDLVTDSLLTSLKGSGFDKNKKTIFIAEGLTVYLPEIKAQKLFSDVNSIMTESSEFLLSIMPQAKSKNGLLNWLLKLYKEEHQSGCAPENMIKYADERGYLVVEKFTTKSSMPLFEREGKVKEYYSKSGVTPEPYYTFVINTLDNVHRHTLYANIDAVPEIIVKKHRPDRQGSPTVSTLASNSAAYIPAKNLAQDRLREQQSIADQSRVSRSPDRPEKVKLI